MSSRETEFDAVVVGRAQAADSIDVFELARADASALPRWQPGAHIDLVLPSGDERQYSLLPSPLSDASTWRIAVLREPSGRGRHHADRVDGASGGGRRHRVCAALLGAIAVRPCAGR